MQQHVEVPPPCQPVRAPADSGLQAKRRRVSDGDHTRRAAAAVAPEHQQQAAADDWGMDAYDWPEAEEEEGGIGWYTSESRSVLSDSVAESDGEELW
eukprot:XP_001690718.1 predicted protein [Chlamydomonas reinhardtii]